MYIVYIYCTYHPNKENSATSFAAYVYLYVMKTYLVRFKFLINHQYLNKEQYCHRLVQFKIIFNIKNIKQMSFNPIQI
jgi:hypothetical protein